MKKLITLLFALITFVSVRSQSCLPNGITFNSQAAIDNFQTNYPGCTEIKGDVTILELFGENILNLHSLSVLHTIGGNLHIETTPSLTSLNGLNNLVSIGGDLEIVFQSGLTNLTGLTNLNSIGGGLYIYCNSSIKNLTGLENVTTIGGSLLIFQSTVTSLTGLNNLNSVGESFTIDASSLTDLAGLENLTSIGGFMHIWFNNDLKSLAAFNNLKSVEGAVWIMGNPLLTSLTGLVNVNTASITELNVYNNQTLSSCEVQYICNYLTSPKGVVNIHSNAPGCNNPTEVSKSCGNIMSCLQYGNYFFNTQTDVDNFQKNYPNCTELQGNVVVQGDITNLDGLANITSVSGNLEINNSPTLVNLNGLRNLTFLGGDLTIRGSTTWSGYCIYPALTGLSGLEKLTAIGGSFSLSCLEIHDFSGLGNLKSIGGDLNVKYTAINSFTGMENLSSIGGNFYLGYWQAEGGSAEGNNAYLTSFAGLNNLTFIGGDFEIWGQQSLNCLTGLYNLDSIRGHILIHRNPCLTTLTGLDNLKTIGGSLQISGNGGLTSLKGLDNISPGTIKNLYIYFNPMVSNCAIKSICDYLASPTGEVVISDNAPGCNSLAEVETACNAVSVNDPIPANGFSVYPNPSSDIITIETSESPFNSYLSLVNLNGQELLYQQTTKAVTEMDISNLPGGIYFIKVRSEKAVEVRKIIKK